jgi:hypothetical protein
MVRNDLTISLEEELIAQLLDIAEKHKVTLSSLIREIITSYISGDQPQIRTEEEVISTQTTPDLISLKKALDRALERLAAHQRLIDDCLTRITTLEGSSGTRSIPAPVHQAHPSDTQGTDSAVIDTDATFRSGPLSEDALVKRSPRPSAPVMTAVEYGSSASIEDLREYSLTETAVFLMLSSGTVRKYVKEQKIPARRIGRAWFFLGKDIKAFMNLR